MMAKLMEHLLTNNLTDEVQKALTDEDARAKFYVKYGITEAMDSLSV